MNGCYRNWMISAVPHSDCWTAAYCPPTGEAFVDGKSYETPEAAMIAAREFVDRSIVGATLLDFLYEIYEAKKISTPQYSKLVDSLIYDCL